MLKLKVLEIYEKRPSSFWIVFSWTATGPLWQDILELVKALPQKERIFLKDRKCWEVYASVGNQVRLAEFFPTFYDEVAKHAK